MNINARYWHSRQNDPDDLAQPFREGNKSIIEFKFSFANCLDDSNEMFFDDVYRPRVEFGNLSRVDDLVTDRFPRVAGWHATAADVWTVLREVADRLM